jgi:hypothetical protein
MAVIIRGNTDFTKCPHCSDEFEGIIDILRVTRTRIVDAVKSYKIRCVADLDVPNALRCKLPCGGEFVLLPHKYASTVSDWICE